MLSAFGATEYPTTLGLDPNECAEKLGAYVKSNNFDGVDVDYEDNKAMTEGTG
jgi:chitinase